MADREPDHVQIAALQEERARVEPTGDTARLAAIDEQLKLYGYAEAAEKRQAAAETEPDKGRRTAPQGRTAPGKQTS